MSGNKFVSRACALIFDMDGTMVDNMGFHARSWLVALAAHGLCVDEQDFRQRSSGKTTTETLLAIWPHLSVAEMDAISNRKESLYRELYRPHLTPVVGLIQFLEMARKLDIPMAVATSAGAQNIRFVLNGLGVTSYFKATVGAEDIQHSKPHPEIFLIAAQRLSIAPEHCLVFEDSLAGIEAAHRAGMDTVVVTTSLAEQAVQNLQGVRAAIRDFSSPNALKLMEIIIPGSSGDQP